MKTFILRTFIGVLILTIVIFAVMVWIGGTDMMSVTAMGKEVTLSSQKAFLVGTFYTIGVILIWSFLKFLADLPRRLRTGVSRRKQGQALEALEDAMIAASAGDADKARKKAARARNLIDRPVLGNIVSAQAAEVSGDPAEAEAQYKTMLDDEKTRRVGQRGLASLAFARGDMSTAISHAEQAYSENRDAKWAFDILFNAKVANSDWRAALDTLAIGEKRKHISKDISRRRSVVLKTAQADELADQGKIDALDMAVKAASDDPAFVPATALASRLLVKEGHVDRAGKVIEKAWREAPHPALALAYRDLKTDETPKARAKRIKNLIKQNSTHRESVLLAVEEALTSGDGVTAWTALAPLAKKDADPSARICQLAAQAEALCENPADAQLWTQRCVGAPVEADWSDLDPEGPAFTYSDTDWRRMIYSYGDKGELIHPRYERFEKMRPAGLGLPEISDTPDNSKTPEVSDPKDSDSKTSKSKASEPELAEIVSRDKTSKAANSPDIVSAPSPDDPGVKNGPKKSKSIISPF